MKMKKNVTMNGFFIKNTYFPDLGDSQEDILNNWEGINSPYSGHDLISKVLTMAGYEDFYKRKYKRINDTSFIIYTKDGRNVKVTINYCTVDIPSEVIINDGNKEEHYEVMTINGTEEIIINAIVTKDLSNHTMQFYDSKVDSFSKDEGNFVVYVSIGRDDESDSEEFYFIDEDIKQEFFNTKFNNILEVYKFIKERFNINTRLITITSYDKSDRRSVDRIEVLNGATKNIELSSLIDNKHIRFEVDSAESELLNDLINEAQSSSKKMRLTIN